MLECIAPIVFLAIALTGFKAIGQDTTEIFYDIHWEPVLTKSQSFYYRKAWKTPQGIFKANDYYTYTNQLQMSGSFLDSAFTVMHGQFNYYYFSGHHKTVTQYDSHGLETGLHRSWYDNGTLDVEANYKGDSLNGKYVSYHPNGKVYITVSFRNGAASNERYYSDDGVYLGGKPEKQAEYTGGMDRLNGYLSWYVRYPEAVREAGVEGRVVVRFCVSDSGIINKILVLESSGNNLLDAEATRAVREMPLWQPAEYQGKPVETYLTLPVTFQLN